MKIYASLLKQFPAGKIFLYKNVIPFCFQRITRLPTILAKDRKHIMNKQPYFTDHCHLQVTMTSEMVCIDYREEAAYVSRKLKIRHHRLI